MTTLYTIGHSRHAPDHFVGLLKAHGIAAVYDVRSMPRSRFSPQFNRETLKDILAEDNIGYVFMGDLLGGKPQPAPALFERGLARLRADAAGKRIAIMCAEKDPMNCHRTWTIAQNLPDMEVLHILADGSLQNHSELDLDKSPKQAAFGF